MVKNTSTSSGDPAKIIDDASASLAAATTNAERDAAENADTAAKAEAERIAADVAAKADAERVAADTAAKADAERVAAEAAAKAEAERVAAEDAAIEKKRADDEADMRAEAAQLASGSADGDGQAAGILFDTSETRAEVTTTQMLDWFRRLGSSDPLWLVFGSGGQSTALVPAQQCRAGDFQVIDGGISFQGDFETMASSGGGIGIDEIGLAPHPDGPVVSLCAIAGGVVMRPGEAFRFGPGAFVFR